MTVEPLIAQPDYLVAGIGPYAVLHPYRNGTLSVVCVKDGARSVLDARDWAVTPAESDTTGNIVLTTAAAAAHDGATLSIRRTTPAEQGWSGIANARERGLEKQLNQMVMATQDQGAEIGRALRFDASVDPVPVAPGFLAFDPDGRPYFAGGAPEDTPVSTWAVALLSSGSALAALSVLGLGPGLKDALSADAFAGSDTQRLKALMAHGAATGRLVVLDRVYDNLDETIPLTDVQTILATAGAELRFDPAGTFLPALDGAGADTGKKILVDTSGSHGTRILGQLTITTNSPRFMAGAVALYPSDPANIPSEWVATGVLITRVDAGFYQPALAGAMNVLPYSRMQVGLLRFENCNRWAELYGSNALDDVQIGELRVKRCAQNALLRHTELSAAGVFIVGDTTFTDGASTVAGVATVPVPAHPFQPGDMVAILEAGTGGRAHFGTIQSATADTITLDLPPVATVVDTKVTRAGGGIDADYTAVLAREFYAQGYFRDWALALRRNSTLDTYLKLDTGEGGLGSRSGAAIHVRPFNGPDDVAGGNGANVKLRIGADSGVAEAGASLSHIVDLPSNAWCARNIAIETNAPVAHYEAAGIALFRYVLDQNPTYRSVPLADRIVINVAGAAETWEAETGLWWQYPEQGRIKTLTLEDGVAQVALARAELVRGRYYRVFACDPDDGQPQGNWVVLSRGSSTVITEMPGTAGLTLTADAGGQLVMTQATGATLKVQMTVYRERASTPNHARSPFMQDPADWLTGDLWIIANGGARHIPGNTRALRQLLPALPAGNVLVIYTVAGRTAGTVRAVLTDGLGAGNDLLYQVRSADGIYAQVLTAAAAQKWLEFRPSIDFDGEIRVVQVVPTAAAAGTGGGSQVPVNPPVALASPAITPSVVQAGQPVTLYLGDWPAGTLLAWGLTLAGAGVSGDVVVAGAELTYTPPSAGALVLTVTASNAAGAAAPVTANATVQAVTAQTTLYWAETSAIGQTALLPGAADGTYAGGAISVAAGVATVAAALTPGDFDVGGRQVTVIAGAKGVRGKADLVAALTAASCGDVIYARAEAGLDYGGVYGNWAGATGGVYDGTNRVRVLCYPNEQVRVDIVQGTPFEIRPGTGGEARPIRFEGWDLRGQVPTTISAPKIVEITADAAGLKGCEIHGDETVTPATRSRWKAVQVSASGVAIHDCDIHDAYQGVFVGGNHTTNPDCSVVGNDFHRITVDNFVANGRFKGLELNWNRFYDRLIAVDELVVTGIDRGVQTVVHVTGSTADISTNEKAVIHRAGGALAGYENQEVAVVSKTATSVTVNYDSRSDPDYTPGLMLQTPPYGHPDCAQFRRQHTGNLDDQDLVDVIGNRLQDGDIDEEAYQASGMGFYAQVANEAPGGATMTIDRSGWNVFGNTGLVSALNPFNLYGMRDGSILCNAALPQLGCDRGKNAGAVRLTSKSNTGPMRVAHNVAQMIDVDANVTLENNVVLPIVNRLANPALAADIATMQAAFVAPVFADRSRYDLAAAYAPKPGGTLDLATPVGAQPHADYAARTFTNPDQTAGGGGETAIPQVLGVGSVQADLGSLALEWRTGHAAGELGVAVVAIRPDGSPDYDVPGWAQLTPEAIDDTPGPGGSTAYRGMQILTRIATSAAETPLVYDDSGNFNMGAILSLSAAGAQTILASGVGVATGNTITLPGVTPGGANRAILIAVAVPPDTATAQLTSCLNGDLAAITSWIGTQTTTTSGGGIYVWKGDREAAGAIGATVLNALTADTPYTYAIMEIAPA